MSPQQILLKGTKIASSYKLPFDYTVELNINISEERGQVFQLCIMPSSTTWLYHHTDKFETVDEVFAAFKELLEEFANE